MTARYECDAPPEDVTALIKSCRQRGWTWEAICRTLNATAGTRRWPAPIGSAKWTTYLVRSMAEKKGAKA